MAGTIIVSVREFMLHDSQFSPHMFTADVSLQSAPSAPVHRFSITQTLSPQENDELAALIAKVVERVKREFKDGFV